MSTIVALHSENIKRLKAIDVTPKGSTVVIGGRNGQGKSSLLDSIVMALGGKSYVPAEPIRRGESRAKIVLETEDLIVTRKFTAAGGTTLEVTNRDGLKFGSPQSVLDRLTASISFDPLAFVRADKKAQLAQLQQLLGIDTVALDQERKRVFDERTVKNREVKAQAAVVESLPATGPAAVNVAAIIADLDRLDTENKAIESKKNRVEGHIAKAQAARSAHEMKKLRVADLKRQIADLEAALSAAIVEASQADQEARAIEDAAELMQREAAALQFIDTSSLKQQLAQAEETNKAAARVEQRKAEAAKLASLEKEADALTDRLTEIDQRRRAMIDGAKFPVPNLGFSEDGVTLNGLPLDQASSAEQLRVGLAVACAMNPELKVMLIRDGSLLDDDSLRLVGDLAAEQGAQVWIERVGDDGHCTVVIEDGEAVTPEAPAEQPQAPSPKVPVFEY